MLWLARFLNNGFVLLFALGSYLSLLILLLHLSSCYLGIKLAMFTSFVLEWAPSKLDTTIFPCSCLFPTQFAFLPQLPLALSKLGVVLMVTRVLFFMICHDWCSSHTKQLFVVDLPTSWALSKNHNYFCPM
jgi:hypothetical protein